jgi:hypothetical protein
LRVGSVMPLSRSATGLLFLAFLPEPRWSALLKAELANKALWPPVPGRAAAHSGARTLCEATIAPVGCSGGLTLCLTSWPEERSLPGARSFTSLPNGVH